MNRYGGLWRIALDCGHTLTRTSGEVKQQQLFIGKRLGCETCARQAGSQWTWCGACGQDLHKCACTPTVARG